MLKRIGDQNLLYPMPVALIGTYASNRINFCNIAHVGILNSASPHRISLGINKRHFTSIGIRETGEFSINLPSQEMAELADYVGLVSGQSTDKSAVFETFFGELKHAPLIKNCFAAMECKLVDTYVLPSHNVFIGEIVASYTDSEMMTNGKLDLSKAKPLLFDMSSLQYWSIGLPVAKCWQIGKKLKV